MNDNQEPITILDDRLIELTTQCEQLKNKVTILEQEKAGLQVDYANKLALMKVEYENKELKLRREITDLRRALEHRRAESDMMGREKGKKRKSINQIYEEITGGDSI